MADHTTYPMRVIARIHTDFQTKFGIPRQSGLVCGLRGRIVFEKEFRNPDAVREIEQFSHVWLIWMFSETIRQDWSPTVRPPRLGGNRRVGVFATRSPFRPNPIGLSSVRLDEVIRDASLGPVLMVSGADLKDGTPILDIKPYLPFTDCHADASGGFADQKYSDALRVEIPAELLERIPISLRQTLVSVLEQDPRPSYQNDPMRIYGFPFAGYEIRFTVRDDLLTVCFVEKI